MGIPGEVYLSFWVKGVRNLKKGKFVMLGSDGLSRDISILI